MEEKNNLILEIKALEDVLISLQTHFVGINVLESKPLQQRIKDMLDLQLKLEEDYSVVYDSSLLDNFDYFEEVNKDGESN